MSARDTLYDLIDELKVAMLTTRRRDGDLRSRPMATQKAAAGADLWFVTRRDSAKLAEITHDPHVNLAYYRDGNSEWVSVSGTAIVTDDRATIAALYQPDWSLWFGKEEGGDPRHGTADDPRMVLIGVTVTAAEFLSIDSPRAVVLFELVKGWVTGQEPELGEAHRVGPAPRPTSRS